MRSKDVKTSIPTAPPAAPDSIANQPRLGLDLGLGKSSSPPPRILDAGGDVFALVVLGSSMSNPELLLATQPLLATSGGICGDQF
jgi:hypothetical protein